MKRLWMYLFLSGMLASFFAVSCKARRTTSAPESARIGEEVPVEPGYSIRGCRRNEGECKHSCGQYEFLSFTNTTYCQDNTTEGKLLCYCKTEDVPEVPPMDDGGSDY